MVGPVTDLPPILDYAGPRPQGQRVRLPARSVLRTRPVVGGLDVVETLAGKGGAVGAMVFAVFVLCVLGGGIIAHYSNPMYRRSDNLPFSIFLAVLWVTEAGLLVAVANNTWRRTVLTVRDGGAALALASQLKTRRYEWPAEQVRSVEVVTLKSEAETGPAELRITPWSGPCVILFSGHTGLELEPIAEAFRIERAGEGPEAASDGAEG